MAWRAVCDCGWRGFGHDHQAQAEHDREVHEWVHRTVDSAPPLSRDTIRKVRALFGLPVQDGTWT